MLGCIILGEKNAFPVDFDAGKTIGQLKQIIKSQAGLDSLPHKLKLWKVSIIESKKYEINEGVDIKEKFGGEKLDNDLNTIGDHFKEQPPSRHIHIIVEQPPPATLPQDVVDWSNVNSIYNWIKTLKRSSEIAAPKLVDSYGAKFPLQGRDETMKILFNGNGSRDGMCQRFENRKKIDRNIHPIPLLANGPGTGKSRFLQEIPTLLRENAENYMNDDKLLNRIKDRMYAINVTFGNSTPAKLVDASLGETSVALRILFGHFIAGGTIDYEKFVRMCGDTIYNQQITISGAFEIVLKDIGTDIDIIIFGIDELNILHSKRGYNNPVREIVHAVGGLNCSGSGSPFYVPILAGTIQGPLEEMFRESTYRFLPLPLRLLREREVRKISEFIACYEHNHALKDYIKSDTFHRCISDFGGQIRALEIFYIDLLKKLKRGTNNVDYIHCVSHVKEELMDRYKFKKFANIITPAIAHAILNIPVSKDDEADKGGKISYIDLSSEGILNLEKVANNTSFYVRMPYIWMVILTSYNKSCKFWEAMIRQDSHIFWESFEFFNMKFWTLRLALLSILNKNKNVTMKDLFRGAYNLNEFEFLEHQECEFKLPDESSIKYRELKHRYPHISQDEHLSPCTVYKNCKGTPIDLFFFINNYLFAIQVKSSDDKTNQPQTLSKKMIKAMYDKTEKAFKKLKEKFPELKDWMLFICTNGPKAEDALDLLYPNCLVIYKANFKDFYGYTYSSRAEFSEANDKLDANTASEYELRTVEKVKEKTAHEICKKRLFNDEVDLYSKVSMNKQAKKRIKVVKKN
ncbi:uncharacterized protein OCT59_027996 [Rhizophagus irregularis]|uniref:Crinkler effector protein N-terminal domain-containing protein n=3 Tax=Rhizophagus irregularis TaxID=588596 RepID=A0A015LKB3_RHIIW|nr:hypothetical protein RirG_063220 [Rhizophagus irregularis DAOM 197198w]UZO07720.1 hypothetical protein OCT59_027996 [Rhizophagus irregularis]GBC49917.1 hypothetical protein GLOIN_2v1627418 [Rhizophagus irregularis DAOM 181602=DAOM 197198]